MDSYNAFTVVHSFPELQGVKTDDSLAYIVQTSVFRVETEICLIIDS